MIVYPTLNHRGLHVEDLTIDIWNWDVRDVPIMLSRNVTEQAQDCHGCQNCHYFTY